MTPRSETTVRNRHIELARTTCCGLLALGLAAHAEAFVRPVISSPVTAALPVAVPGGHRFDYCSGAAPLTWEVMIANEGPSAATVIYEDDIQDGTNGDQLTLTCPPVLLPPGVDPVNDVDCDPVNHTLEIRNILVPPCSRAFIRFETQALSSILLICNGGDVIEGARTVPTKPPFTDQDPRIDDTCVFVNPMCGPGPSQNVKLSIYARDENGFPTLPGDTVVWDNYMDFRWSGFVPPMKYLWQHAGGVGQPLPIDSHLDFLGWTAKPLEPPANAAEYLFDAGTRILEVRDPDPAVAPSVDLAPNAFDQLGAWRSRIQCDVPRATNICHFGFWTHTFGGFIAGDDPETYTNANDAICVMASGPDFSTSTKNVTDAGRSRDAQPGEILTYEVSVNNTGVCSGKLLDCECDADDVTVRDTFDTVHIEISSILNGGLLAAPDTIEWVIPSVGALGRTGSSRSVLFYGRVRTDAPDGTMICNSATITSPEITNVAEGGLSDCPTKPATRVADNCIRVVIPATPLVVIDKTVAPPLVPPNRGYPVGDTLTFTITVSNPGGADATNVQVWDCLDAAIDPLLVDPLLGTKNGLPAPVPACASGNWIRWPAIPLLAALGGRVSYDFEVTIPLDTSDGRTLRNTASSSSVGLPTVASNEVQAPVCAPRIELTKRLPLPVYLEGQAIEWILTVSNPSGCAATGIDVRDVIDLTLVEDVPVLTWTDPPGAASVYDALSGTITWTLPSLPSAASVDFTITSQVRTGVAPTTVCNDAQGSWAQGLDPVTSTPACADVETGCSQVAAVPLVKGHRLGAADVRFAWAGLVETIDGYRVCTITGDKAAIPTACEAGVPGVVDPVPTCDLTAATECVHNGGLPPAAGNLLFYQVKGVCGLIEGR